MKIWEKIKDWLQKDHELILMYVVDSEGSSPGRRGFKMIINDEGEMYGSIGGGFMEHKLVELCKKELMGKAFEPFIKRQIHRPDLARDRSGMICSGEQTVAFYPIGVQDAGLFEAILTKKGLLIADQQGLHFHPNQSISSQFETSISSPSAWQVKENLHFQPCLHIIGGGHVGLALSKFASELDFNIKVYDDREGLNTMARNQFAEGIVLEDYDQITAYLPEGPDQYVVLMSFGYRTDKVILKQLLGCNFKYLGMLGSQKKVESLFAELREEGFAQELMDRVHAPIGLQIHSKTPAEIAVSILAEIIALKNRPMEKQNCAECESLYFKASSQMAGLCPECAHYLYGYENCKHQFEDGRCLHCHWDGSESAMVKKLKEQAK